MGDAGPQIGSSSQAGLPSLNPTKSYWQTSHPNATAEHRSTSSLPSNATVVVIGTGITGVFAAHEILSHSTDIDVLVMEARTLCSSATGRNGGHLVPIIHEQRPGIIAWELRNFHHVAGLIESEDIPCDFRKLNGCLGFWNKTYFEEAKEALKEAAVVAPEQTLDAVRVVEDAVGLEELNLVGAVGAIVQTTAASLSPYKLVTWLWQDLLKKHEGTGRLNLQTNTPVTSLTPRGRESNSEHILTTDRGTITASHIILATNGYTSHLLPDFSSLISPTQAQMTAQLPPSDSPFSTTLIPQSYGFVGIPGMDHEMSDYLVQRPISEDGTTGRGELMYGGGRHAAKGYGVGVSDDSYIDPDVENHLRGLPERLNLAAQGSDRPVHLELLASWTGIIGSSFDGFPWVGGVPGHPGMFLAAGYSGHGMPNASLSGRHVARLVLESLRDGGDWSGLQKAEVELTEKKGLSSAVDSHAAEKNFGVPVEYVITRERMDKARG